MARRDVVVFGGSGFIGRYLVRRLTADGWRAIVAVRDPERAHFLQPLGDVGQVAPVRVDITRSEQVAAAVSGAEAVVNLVGVLHERGRRTFHRVHVEGAGNVAEAAARAGCRRMAHVSAIGASPRSPSSYARSKAAGERAVFEAMPDAAAIRPGVVFGAEDGFFNLFGRMATLSPVIPLFGGGATRFQPVYVDDVAAAIVRCLDDPGTNGRVFELGGPSIYSFRQLMEIVRRETRRKVVLAPVPFPAAHVLARFLQFLPGPPLTPDQVRLLRIDNVVGRDMPGFDDLGVVPTTVEATVPRYLSLYRRGGARGGSRFDQP